MNDASGRGGDGSLLDRLGEGESFHIGGLNAELGNVEAIVIEDTLVYLLPDVAYQEMRAGQRKIDRYFSGMVAGSDDIQMAHREAERLMVALFSGHGNPQSSD